MTTASAIAPEVCRWIRVGDGSRIALDANGSLTASWGIAGRNEVLRTGATLADARAFVARQPDTWRGRGPGAARTESGPKLLRRPAHVERTSCGHDHLAPSLASLSPEQIAERDARILAHRARVEAEMRRLGCLPHDWDRRPDVPEAGQASRQRAGPPAYDPLRALLARLEQTAEQEGEEP